MKNIIQHTAPELIRGMRYEDSPIKQKDNQAQWSEIGLHKKAKWISSH